MSSCLERRSALWFELATPKMRRAADLVALCTAFREAWQHDRQHLGVVSRSGEEPWDSAGRAVATDGRLDIGSSPPLGASRPDSSPFSPWRGGATGGAPSPRIIRARRVWAFTEDDDGQMRIL